MVDVIVDTVLAPGFLNSLLGIWLLVGIVLPELLKPRRFGRIFGVKERTVRDWITARKIEVVKVQGSVRIPAAEAERLVREGRRPAILRRPNPEHGPPRSGDELGGQSI